MKKLLKKTITITLISIIMLSFMGCIQKKIVTSEEIQDIVTIHLGELKDIVSFQEKKELEKLLLKAKTLEQRRVKKRKFQKSILEEDYWYKIGMLLDEYTTYYFSKDIEIGGSETIAAFNENVSENTKKHTEDVQVPSEQNYILKELKNKVSKEDYKSICELYDGLESNFSNIDEIATILYDYNIEDVELICEGLMDKDTNIISNFNIKNNLSIQHNHIPFVTDKNISKEELKHYENVWSFIKSILPKEGLKNFKRITFSTDGMYDILAYVIALDESGSEWKMSIDPMDQKNSNKQEFLETIIHEYYHYVTLNNTQVKYTNMQTVSSYNEEGMVTKKDSYINEFYNIFWKDILNERVSIPDSECFYYRHFNDFVTEYAATNPAEDICESFAYFVLCDKPENTTIKNKKVLFFYDYPEMVQLRDLIKHNIKKSETLWNKIAG